MTKILPKKIICALSTLGLSLVGCGPKYVRLAENRAAYTREEGRNLRLQMFASKEYDIGALKTVANTYLGVPYLWGGETMSGIDCSGFTQQVMRKAFSMELPRTAAYQSQLGIFIFRFGLQPGDFVYFGPAPETIEHVGIYMGDGMFINATSSSGVKYSSIDEPYWRDKYQFAKRLLF